MTSGKLTPKADNALRKKIIRRAKEHISLANMVTPDRLLKSPSQKKSENARKRETRRAESYSASCVKAASDLIFDCYTCPKFPCDTVPEACDESMVLERCGGCGKPVRHYLDIEFKWVKCEKCRDGL